MGVLAAVGAVASLAGTAIAAEGAIQQGNAASQAATYNAEVAKQNQQIATNNATQAIQAGEEQANVSQEKTRAQSGAIKAAEAAGNIDVNTGSAVDVQSSAASLGELDAITVRSNAARTAYGYQTQAVASGDTSTLDQAQASNASTASEISAGSTLLSGAGGAASNYSRYLSQTGLIAGGP